MSHIRNSAEKLLVKHKIDSAPVDPEFIAEMEGVDVQFVTFADEASQVVHGFYECSDPEKPKILVNVSDPPEEKLFTIAHELGHHILHKSYAASEGYVPRLKLHIDTTEEREADEFARAMLVPRSVLAQFSSHLSDEKLKAMFLVTDNVLTEAKKNVRQF